MTNELVEFVILWALAATAVTAGVFLGLYAWARIEGSRD